MLKFQQGRVMLNRLRNGLFGRIPAPRAPVEVPNVQMSKLKRAIGICRNPACDEYNKDIFLINHEDTFKCVRCGRLGLYKLEIGLTKNRSLDFYQVRVEFNFDPNLDAYRSVAVVTDESMDKTDGNVYTLKSALIRTDKRALQVAEALLGNLMQATEEVFDGGGLGRAKEHVLHFDHPRELFNIELEMLGQELETSRLRKKT